MSTITRRDISDYVILPVLAGEFDTDTTAAIIDAVIAAAPLHTWTLAGTHYESSVLSVDDFWAIVEHVATGEEGE